MTDTVPQTSLLSVRDLRIGFGRGPDMVSVVHGVSFTLEAAHTLAIVGESGSGKSVTALSINRLIDFGGGRIIEGSIGFRPANGRAIDLATASERQLRAIRGNEIGMIFQEPMTSLNPVKTIGWQIAEAYRLHRGLSGAAALAEARRMLERVRIPDAAQRLGYFPHQLSGGMRQRVMIAMALACNPRLLIADEPTTALDVTVQAQIMALLAELRHELGMAMIVISHDIGLVAQIADTVVVMQQGRAVEQGNLGQILDRPQHPYTQHLLQAVPHFRNGEAARGKAGSTRAAPVLNVTNLTVRYPISGGLFRRSVGSVHAVEAVDFELRVGETLAIVGESGSGKSTVARALLGLVRPVRGRIDCPGRDSFAHHKLVQMVFQDPFASLNPRLNVEHLLAEPVIAAEHVPREGLRKRMVALLRRVGLPPESIARFPHEFSGGQRQRLCIARVLMVEPTIVVLDEPVSALDVSIQMQVLDLLIDLQRELGLAYLFISHDMAVVERIAHRVAVMYAGQIVEIGDTKSVLAQPAHSYTRRLISAVPTVNQRHRPFEIDDSELPTLVRPNGFEASPATWETVGPDHRAHLETTP